MDKRLRAGVLGGFVVVATLLAMSSLAWACGGIGGTQSATPGVLTSKQAGNTSPASGTGPSPASSTAVAVAPAVIPSPSPAATPAAANGAIAAAGGTVSAARSATVAAVPSQATSGSVSVSPVSHSATTAAVAATAATPAPGAAAPSPVAAEPSERSVDGNLWSGFDHGPNSSVGSLQSPPASSGSSSDLLVGGATVVGGLLALSVGFATAELRRRRVTVLKQRDLA